MPLPTDLILTTTDISLTNDYLTFNKDAAILYKNWERKQMSPQDKIEHALSRSVCGGWDRGFLESILEQIAKGRDLSAKQKQTLGNVLARNDEAAQKVHDDWGSTYKKEYSAEASVLAQYHLRQPYYQPMAKDILGGRIPQRKKFLRMYHNKYSQKVLSQHKADPKYAVGDYLVTRTSFDSYKSVEFEGDMVWANQNRIIQAFRKRGGFVLRIEAEIVSAAKGAKRYKLLPVGETTPIIVEERYLKKAKR